MYWAECITARIPALYRVCGSCMPMVSSTTVGRTNQRNSVTYRTIGASIGRHPVRHVRCDKLEREQCGQVQREDAISLEIRSGVIGAIDRRHVVRVVENQSQRVKGHG